MRVQVETEGVAFSDNIALVLDQARAALSRQETDVAKVRDRAMALLTAGGLVATLLGGFAGSGSGTFDLHGWTWAGLTSFGLLAASVVFIQWPRTLTFSNDAEFMLDEWGLADGDPDDVAGDLARHLTRHYKRNEYAVVRWLLRAFALGTAALAAEVLFLLIDLRGR